jgi:plasmid stabilization system protein ParE
MGKLIWLPKSKEDIQRLHDFLKDKNPTAAKNAIRTIRTGARQLEDYPEAGRPMIDGSGRRELLLAFGAGGYVLRYKLDGRNVVIVRVWHNREKR